MACLLLVAGELKSVRVASVVGQGTTLVELWPACDLSASNVDMS